MCKMLFDISTIFLCNNFLSNGNNLENNLKCQPNFSLVLLIKVLLIKQKACKPSESDSIPPSESDLFCQVNRIHSAKWIRFIPPSESDYFSQVIQIYSAKWIIFIPPIESDSFRQVKRISFRQVKRISFSHSICLSP